MLCPFGRNRRLNPAARRLLATVLKALRSNGISSKIHRSPSVNA
jgi:hypothetical protein